VRLDEIGQHLRQARGDEILGGAEAHPAAQLRSGEVAPRAVVGCQDGTREAFHRLAIGSGRHRVGIADEQPPPGCLLELADVLADRGLAQTQPAARLTEIAGLGDGEEAFQQHRVQHGALSITERDHSNDGKHASQ
jgi:hypothetical protein